MIKINLQKFIGSIIVIIIVTILIWITPFYNQSFDKIIQTNQQIIIYSKTYLTKNQGLINIQGPTNQNIKIDKGISFLPFINQDGLKISFMAKEIYKDMNIFIQITGNIIKIYPQSSIYINQDSNIINIINGQIGYLNLDQNNKIIFQGNIQPFNLNINDQILNDVFQNQRSLNKKNIIKQYGGNIILNKTFDYTIHKLLLIFTKISPKNYSDNLENYNKFNNYINLDIKTDNQLIFKNNEKYNINKDIFKQFNKGLSKIINSF